MIEQSLTELVGPLPAGHEVEFPRDDRFGDVASNIAFLLARARAQAPGEVAAGLAPKLQARREFSRVTVGGQGFLNFVLSDDWLLERLRDVLSPGFGRSALGLGKRVLVEYVSANPTGPLNVVNDRAGAFGAALVELLRWTGHEVEAEYYVNDSGHQIDLLAQSVAARVAELDGKPLLLPDGGYPGAYLIPIAQELKSLAVPSELWGRAACDRILKAQQASLERYGVVFDSFVRDSEVRQSNGVVLEQLARAGHSYEREGAIWFRAKQFGDSEDRVLVKTNGEPTYALTDLNYHRIKFARGFAHLITVWGPDHHGDIARLRGGLKALGLPWEQLEIIIVQMTSLLRDGQRLAMSKRAGEYVTIDEVLDEIGPDALKFFLLMRRATQQLEFDLALARRTSLDNPVYYVQYGHARISSILRFAQERGVELDASPVLTSFVHPAERALAGLLLRYPDIVEGATRAREPHRLVYYALDLATGFHKFYEQVRVVGDDKALSAFRVWLCSCTKSVLKGALGLVGVKAPERM